MPQTAELKLAELLAARLCHDMASPLAAIDNGIELLNEPGFEESDQALVLIGNSAAQAVASLRFLRSAFGELGDITGQATQIREIASGWLAPRRIRLCWQLETSRVPLEEGRLLLNLLAIAGEMLPRGGVISLTQTRSPAAHSYRALAEGPDAQLRREVTRGLEATSPEGLDPREAHAYFLHRLVQRNRGALEVEAGEDHVSLELILRS